MTDMIRATGLVKRYRDVVALSGLDLTVGEGRVLGLLGPNGAGKTTAVRILTTLLVPDAGSVEIAGIDAARDPDGVRARTHGVTFSASASASRFAISIARLTAAR